MYPVSLAIQMVRQGAIWSFLLLFISEDETATAWIYGEDNTIMASEIA
jgi:hypothetical protein